MPLSDNGAVAELTAQCGEHGSALTVSLWGNNIFPDPDTQPAELVRPTFSGYGAQVSDQWVGPLDLGDGLAGMTSPPFTWVHTDAATAGTNVYGFDLVADGPGLSAPRVLLIQRLETPVSMRKSGSTLDLSINLFAVRNLDVAFPFLLVTAETTVRADYGRINRGTRRLAGKLARLLKYLANADAKAFDQTAEDGVDRLLFHGESETSRASVVVGARAEIFRLRR